MEPLSRCANGHYYDAKKHSSCPFCGVQGLNLEIKKTMAKMPEPPPVQEGETDPGKTVGVFHRKMETEPVVGWLVAVAGPVKGKDFRIIPEKNFIGRSEKMDISIAGDNSISRDNHAIISFNPKKNIFRLFPGESRGLVYLNDEEVVTPEVLKANDIVGIGKSQLMFVPFCGDKFQWAEDEG